MNPVFISELDSFGRYKFYEQFEGGRCEWTSITYLGTCDPCDVVFGCVLDQGMEKWALLLLKSVVVVCV